MKRKSLVVATLVLAMIAIIAVVFVPNVLADTAASYSYPCGSGSANQVFVSSADSTKGLIEPGSAVDANFGSSETWTFTAVPAEGYVFSSWTTSGNSYVNNLSRNSATLSFSYKNGNDGLGKDDSRQFTAVANFIVKPTYSVTYDPNCTTYTGSVPVDSNTYNTGDTVTVLGNTGGLARSGYRFIGWNTRTGYNESTEYGIGRTSYTMGSGVTFYAQWERTDRTYDHIDIRLKGSITIDYKINGVSQPGYPKVLNVTTTAGATCTYVVGGTPHTVPGFRYETSDGGEYRGTGISTLWPDSVTINATLSDGTKSYPFSHTFTGNEIYAAHIECPTDTGYDFILNASEITNQITHNVTFKTTEGGTINGGSADYVATNVPDGTSMSSITPPHAALTGYTFEGWSPALPGTVTADGVYTAQFEPITYTVAYKDISGGSLGSETVAYGHAADEIPTPPAIPGKTFDHWALSGDNSAYADDLNNVMENLVATAVYTNDIYTITYNPGASGALVGASIDTAGYNEHPDFVPGINANTGYRFIGWSSDGGTTLLNEAGVKAIAVTGNITYTAYYEQINYTVKYDLGAHGTTTDTSLFTDKHFGDTTPAAPAVTELPGWTFTNWSPVVAATVTGDATYVAQYTQNEYTVKYDLGTHGSTTDTTEFTGKHYGDPMPTAPRVTEQAGWTFTGWMPTVSATVSGNVTYTAQYTQNVYTVKYDLGTHGSTTDTKEFAGKHYGDPTPTAPVVSAYAGWTFTGWLPTVSATVTGDVIYMAQYTQNVYTVKYDLGAHGTTTDTIEFTGKHYGDATPAAPLVAAEAGWTFTGWLPTLAGTVTGDATYVAQYTQNVYTVKYDLGTHGTTTDTTEFINKHYGDATPTAPVVSAEAGWTFTGWLPVVSATVTGDVTYVAQYTQNVYTVKYDLGTHGSTSNTTEFTGKHYGDATPAAPAVTANAGWSFTGWLPVVSDTVAGDVTYVAQYTQNVYTVKYDLGIHGTTINQTEFTGKHYGDPTPAVPVVTEKAGWTFTGWLPTISLTVTGDVTYAAQYTQNVYTVKYDLGAHGTTTGTTEFTGKHYGDATPDEPTVTEEAGWTFTGWLPAVSLTVKGDVTYVAQYTQNLYTVKYDLGSYGSTTDTTEFNDLHYGDATPDEPTVNAENGYTFLGWLPTVAATVTGDVTYTAQYNQDEYTVKYDLGTHGSTTDAIEFTGKHYGDPTPTAPVVTAEAGWTFTGWLPVVSATVTGDVTYTAQYTQNDYTVRYDLGTHGSTSNTTEFTELHYGDATPSAPAVTEGTGWTFTGWLPVISATVSGDVTYTAQYTQNVYTVKYDLGTHGTTTDTVEFTGRHYGDPTPTAPGVTELAGWTFTGWLPTVAETVTGDVTYTAQYTQNEYTVKFDLGTHGSTTDTIEFTDKHYGDPTPTVPIVTEEAGWTFTGWLPIVADTVTGDVTYVAQYTQNEYTVKFDIGTHGSTADTKEFAGKHYGDPTPTAPIVTEEAGWTFTGWLPTVAATVTGDVTYTAQYTQNEYTVKYDLGTHGTTTDTTEFTGKHYGDPTPAAPAITEETGWTFTGWLPVVSETVAGDVTYVAQYTQNDYTVKYDLGTYGTTTDTTEFTGKHYGDPTPAAPAVTQQAGWTFTGWLPVVSATVAGDVTYVAQYTQNDYTVKYDLGTHGTTADTTEFGGKHYGDPTPAAPQVTANTGWTFTGWLPVVSTTVAGDVTYAAQYAPKEYTVTFVDADGTTVLGTDTVTHGGGATAPSNPAAPAGYHFTGWDKDYSNVTSDLTVKAQYAINTYTVRFFRADGVTQIGTTQTINWGGAAALATAPARTGATFTGWVLTGDNDTVATSLTNVRENIDAVAGYNPDVFVVRFEDFDGTLLGTDQVLYGGDATPPSAPTREGYDFTGWSPRYDNVTGNMTVVAEYTIKTFTVTFVNFDGTVIGTQTVDWNTGATAPEVPDREGYEFTGWDRDFNPVTSSITVTAQFEEIAAPTPEPTEIPDDEPVPTTGGAPSPLWWLLLIPGLGLLIWLLLAWLSIVPIAEAVTNNGDGTMTIQWGYENRKGRKKKIDDEDSQLTALSGNVIRNSQEPPIEFEKGRVENVFTTVAAVGSKIQWKIKNRKANVDLSKANK